MPGETREGGEGHSPRARRAWNPPAAQRSLLGRCVKLAGHHPPHRRPGARKRPLSPPLPRPPHASSSSPSPPPDLFFPFSRPQPHGGRSWGEGDVSITLSTLPLPRDGDNGPFPPDAEGGAPDRPAGELPHHRDPQFPQPPRCEEGAGKAPGPRPLPGPEEGRPPGRGYTPRC